MANQPSKEDFQPNICWVVALKSEAKPLIEIFNLQCISNILNFPIYLNAETGHALVISGIGAAKAAAAVTYLKMFFDVQSYAAWINFGIAGYYSEPVGQLYQAVKVYDQARNKSYFPGVRLSKILASETLYTVAQPEKAYLQSVLFDMEASGFCEITPTFSCNELVFVFKIVSDTRETSLDSLSKKWITSLIYQNVDEIQKIVLEVSHFVNCERERLCIPQQVFRCFEMYHFTQTNRYKFLEVYRKWKTAFPKRILLDSMGSGNSAKELICSLENELLIASKDWNLT